MEEKDIDFKKLLIDSQSLISQFEDESVTISRNLFQLDALSRKLAQRNLQRTAELQNPEAQAQLLAARSGIDLSEQPRILKQIDLSRAYEGEPLNELDIDQFLAHQHSLHINTAIEEASKHAADAFRRNYIQNMEEDWQQEKRKLLHSVNVHKVGGSSRMEISAPPTDSKEYDRAYEHVVYMKSVEELVKAKNKGEKVSLDFFIENAENIKKHYISVEEQKLNLAELERCWKLLKEMIDEKAKVDVKDSKNADVINAALVQGVKTYSEKLYHDHIMRVRTDGRPDLRNHVKAYVDQIRNRMPQGVEAYRESVDARGLQGKEYPIWALIFFCFRCGDLKASYEYALKLKGKNSENQQFVACLKQIADNPSFVLERKRWEALNREFNIFLGHSKSSIDPYQLTMYHIIGRFKVTGYNLHVLPGLDHTEDYLWLKLTLLEYTEESQNPAFKLETLQKELIKFGSLHFNRDGKCPVRYFKVLLMSLQFSEAVEFLAKTEYSITALNFAIALYHYGLIEVDVNNKKDSKSQAKVQILRLIESNLPENDKKYNAARLLYLISLLPQARPPFIEPPEVPIIKKEIARLLATAHKTTIVELVGKIDHVKTRPEEILVNNGLLFKLLNNDEKIIYPILVDAANLLMERPLAQITYLLLAHKLWDAIPILTNKVDKAFERDLAYEQSLEGQPSLKDLSTMLRVIQQLIKATQIKADPVRPELRTVEEYIQKIAAKSGKKK